MVCSPPDGDGFRRGKRQARKDARGRPEGADQPIGADRRQIGQEGQSRVIPGQLSPSQGRSQKASAQVVRKPSFHPGRFVEFAEFAESNRNVAGAESIPVTE